jgi:hypothetical protein
VRLVITYSVISKLNSKQKTNNYNFSGFEIFFLNLLFFVWVILLPLVVLTYLRNHQNDLLSRKQIIKFGSLYLSYRGISKDIYAILMQVKFIAVPYACILYGDVGDFIYYICGFIFAYYICFVTISKPFSKVWKVFNESLSFLILIIFCFSFIIMRKIDANYKNQIYSYYTYLSMILGLLVIRSFRILIDTSKRLMEIMKMRMPKERDFSHEAEAENQIQLDVLSNKLKEKVDEMQNKDAKILSGNINSNVNVKDEERKTMKEFEYDEDAEYNVENMSDDEDKSREGKSDNDNNKSINNFDKDNFVVNVNDENKKFKNSKNFFNENKHDLNLHNQVILNKFKNNSQIMVHKTNPDESKASQQCSSYNSSKKKYDNNSKSVYVSENSKNQSGNNGRQNRKERNREIIDDQFYNSESHYNSGSQNISDSNGSNSHKDRRSNLYQEEEETSNYNNKSREVDSEISQTASNQSRGNFNSENKSAKKNSNFAPYKNKDSRVFDKGLTNIHEETNSSKHETSEKLSSFNNSSGRSNNSQVELNSIKTNENERSRIFPNEDKIDEGASRGRNANEIDRNLDDLKRDVSAERNEVLKKFKVKKNKKKNKF